MLEDLKKVIGYSDNGSINYIRLLGDIVNFKSSICFYLMHCDYFFVMYMFIRLT